MSTGASSSTARPGGSPPKVAAGARVEVSPRRPRRRTRRRTRRWCSAWCHEDAHLVVVDKPAGLVVHPARGHETGTLVNGLLARGGFERASLRRSGGASGPASSTASTRARAALLVVAKDAPTREALQVRSSRAHDIEREYVAIVVGARRATRPRTLHGRHRRDRLRFTSKRRDAGKPRGDPRARARALGAAPRSSRAGSRPGARTRSASTSPSAAGTPILGDPLYGRKPPQEPALRAVAAALGRQALHARVLGFVHPATGRAVRWESPLPDDLARCLAALRPREA